ERGVLARERLDDLAVLVRAAVRELRAAVRQREERRAADEALHEAVEHGVAGKLGEQLVEADREALAGLAVAALVGTALLGNERAQLRGLLRREPAREALQHRGLDHAPRLEDVARLRRARVRDHRAAVGPELDEQAVAQARERRAHRAAARAEQLGEVALDELGAGGEAMVEDR